MSKHSESFWDRLLHRLLPAAAALGLLLAAATASAGGLDAGAPVPHPASGRLIGTVAVGPELSSRRIRFHLYPDFVAPAEARSDAPLREELKNVVVYFESVPDAPQPSGPAGVRPVMRQEGITFLPHVLAVPRGTTVEFPNADPIFHNVFSLSKAASFDLGRYPRGSSKSVRLDKPGIVRVFCHIHSDMSGIIMVLESRYFATPDPEGRFEIDGVPPGEYRVVAWHERARPQSRAVRIEPGRQSLVDFIIPLTEESGGG